MKDWKPHRLDQLGSVARGKSRHRPRNDPALYGGQWPFFQTGDVKAANLYLSTFSQTYNDVGLAQSKLWPSGTLCITIAANIADTAILAIPGCFPDSVVGFIADPVKADARFIKYYIEILKQGMQNASRGTTQDNLSVDKLLTFDFLVPSADRQREIASILSAYDDLIENNTRRIAILEEMARRIYEEWFVRFRFPGHESVRMVESELGLVPEGWELKCLDELADIKGGKQLGKEEIHETGSFPVYGGNGVQGFSKRATHTGFVIAFGRVGAYCGSIHWSLNGAWLNNNSSSIVPHSHEALILQHLLLFNFNPLRGGAAQPFISNGALAGIKLLTPNDDVADRFTEIATPIRELQDRLHRVNLNLRATRDFLLPKLISGELDVSALPDPEAAAA